jgi:hypothetical protein
MLGLLMAPGQAPANVGYISSAKIDVPIRYNPNLKDSIQTLQLHYSRDEGRTWALARSADPSQTKFAFEAPGDGLYWLAMVTVDKNGTQTPSDPSKFTSPMKIFIDTKPPIVQIKSIERNNDEINVSWTVDEPNPDWNKFQLDYRTTEAFWTPVNVKGSASGSARFRLANAGQISIRVTAYDLAGNRTEEVKNYSGAPSVIPSKETGSSIQTARFQPPPSDLMLPGGGGPATPTNPVPPGPPPVVNPVPPAPSPANNNPPLRPAPSSSDIEFHNPDPRTAGPLPGSTGLGSQDRALPTHSAQNEVPTGASVVNSANLPPLQVINVTRFDVAFDVENRGPSGVSRAEIWVTRDDGKNWQRWDVSEKGESPVTVDLGKHGNNQQIEGVYGIKIILQSGAGLSSGPPVSGDVPDMRVDVDLAPPTVKIYEPVVDRNQRDTLILRWQATDRNLSAEPITLEWGEGQDGPWNPIVTMENGNVPLNTTNSGAKRIPNTGQYSWKLPQNFPTHQVYLRVTARDTAGNIAEHKTLKPILVDRNTPVARIQGIIGAADKR